MPTMFWDLAIAVLLALLAAGTTGLAGHLAATKPWQKWIFWGSGVLMVALIAVQTYKSTKAQGDLEAQLSRIQKNTETPPTVNVKVPPPEIVSKAMSFADLDHVETSWDQKGSRLVVNVFIRNKSSEPAQNVYSIFTSPLLSGLKDYPPSGKVEAEIYAAFEKRHRPLHLAHPTLGPGDSTWGTVVLQPFDEKMLTQINSRKAVLFVVGATFFSDDVGKHRKDFCIWLQPPFTPGRMVSDFCKTHNNLRY